MQDGTCFYSEHFIPLKIKCLCQMDKFCASIKNSATITNECALCDAHSVMNLGWVCRLAYWNLPKPLFPKLLLSPIMNGDKHLSMAEMTSTIWC